MDEMYKKADELNGQVSGEHGIGFAKKPYLKKSLSPDVLEVMRGIKTAFDPKNILNPGKVC
jgi:glycolate oxidase